EHSVGDLGGSHRAQAIDVPAELQATSPPVRLTFHTPSEAKAGGRQRLVLRARLMSRSNRRSDMRIALLALAATLAVAPAMAAPLELHRGVAVHQWLNWSPLEPDGSYRWPPYLTQAEWLAADRPASDWAT